MEYSDPLAFLDMANMDPEVNAEVLEAIVGGSMVSAEAIMDIARRAGFSFTREEFESVAKENIKARFAAGEVHLADVVAEGAKKPVPSSCADGCVSWTTNYHPKAHFDYQPQATKRD